MLNPIFTDTAHFVISARIALVSLIVTLAFTLLARWLQAVSKSGAVAGAVVCFLLYAGAGFGAFAALASVFLLAWITTRLGHQRKEKLGTAEKIGGRTASQVVANLGLAAVCAVGYAAMRKPVFLLAIAAALSEAAADTVSSEIGQVSHEHPRLISNWTEVPAGTDGGITIFGTLSGLSAAVVVTIVCVVCGMLPWNRIGIPVFAAFSGMIADSFLGALLERRKLLNNDLVNFLGTLVAALIVFLMR